MGGCGTDSGVENKRLAVKLIDFSWFANCGDWEMYLSFVVDLLGSLEFFVKKQSQSSFRAEKEFHPVIVIH